MADCRQGFILKLSAVKVTDIVISVSMTCVRLDFLQRFTQFQRKCDCSLPQKMCGKI